MSWNLLVIQTQTEVSTSANQFLIDSNSRLIARIDQTRQNAKRGGDASKQEGLEGMEMEEEKRSLIHREIDKVCIFASRSNIISF